jgi:hypothetical protein
MNDKTLIRLSGFAALAGGGLRIAGAFLSNAFAAQTLEVFYFVTDVLLLAGLLGIYLPRRLALGWSGLTVFLTAVIGLLIVRSANVRFFGIGGYGFGAPIALIGATLLGVSMALKGEQRLAAAFWLSSLAIGIAGSFAEPSTLPQAAAGVLFGAGFVVAGTSMFVGQSANYKNFAHLN